MSMCRCTECDSVAISYMGIVSMYIVQWHSQTYQAYCAVLIKAPKLVHL